MKIGENSFVSISYTLTVDGKEVENVPVGTPLEFPFGMGFLLPTFESHLAGLEKGGKFAFTLAPADAYGELIPDAVVELPSSVFMIDGAIEEGLLTVGNQLPMSDNQGNRMVGTIKEVNAGSVVMDFNHPMAGKTLNFEGEVVGVRELSPEDLQAMSGGCGCGCGDDCSDEGCSSGGCGCN